MHYGKCPGLDKYEKKKRKCGKVIVFPDYCYSVFKNIKSGRSKNNLDHTSVCFSWRLEQAASTDKMFTTVFTTV